MVDMGKRTALVTGGNRGIGFAICKGLAEEYGMKTLLGSRQLEAGQAAAGELKGEARAVELDLEDRSTLRAQVDRIREEHPKIDVLANNGGILEEGGALSVSEAAFERSLRVNLLGAFDLMRWLIPSMEKTGYGRIVNVSSGWGSMSEGLGGPAAYSVSKAALNAMTLSVSREVSSAVKINAMCPGWVRTRMGGQEAERSPEEGADTAIWLATLPDTGPSGGFFRDRALIEW